MVATVGVYLRGGLGNRLFLAAAAHGIAATSGRVAVIVGADPSAHSGRTYVDSVFGDFARRPAAHAGAYAHAQVTVVEPANRCLSYDGPPMAPIDASILLSGYFQNERYLEGQKAEFAARLRLPPVSPEAGAIFIHVRRGDYLRNRFHAVDLSGYFARAVELAKTTFGARLRRVLAFSDDPAWCRSNLAVILGGDLLVEVAEDADEEVALARMAACELGGICANSSFSWWGAFLGYAPDKLVTFPSTWFNHAPSSDPGAGAFVNDVAFAGSVRVEC